MKVWVLFACVAGLAGCEGNSPVTKTDAAADAPLAGATKFVGRWTFTSGMQVVVCNDGSSKSKPLTGQELDVTAWANGALAASYQCNWDLVLAPDEMSTVISLARAA